MKKILAAALALSLSAAMFTACGDDSSSSSSAETTTTTTTAAADSSSVAEASSEDASSADASSEDASSADASSADASSGEDGAAEVVDISKAAEKLAKYDNALVTFKADTDVTKIVKDMQEGFASIKAAVGYVEAGKDDKGKPYDVEKFNKVWGAKGEVYGIDAKYDSDYVKKVLADDTADLKYISGDESRCKYSIEEVAGIPMLKIEILDKYADGVNYLIPKPQFKLNEIFKGHEDLLPKVNVIKMDIIQKAVGEFTGEDGTSALVPGNLMGTLAVQAQKDGSMTWDQNDFAADEWTSEWVYVEAASKELLIWNKSDLANTTDDQYATIMRWGIPNDACLYIADIAFYDIDGNPIKF